MTQININPPQSAIFLDLSRPDVKRDFPIMWGIPMDELNFSRAEMYHLCMGIAYFDEVGVTLNTIVAKARNMLHESFLLNDKVEWLMMVDSDIGPPPYVAEKLLSRNKKLIGGWYYTKRPDKKPAVYSRMGHNAEGHILWRQYDKPMERGVVKVDGAGAGCWLMHKDVARAIGKHPYNFERGAEDLEMCLKVKEAGFDIYIDWSIYCEHIGVTGF